MHQRIAALFVSFAITSLVMLIGWELAQTSLFAHHAEAVEASAPLSPPALQPFAGAASATIAANESIASR